MLPWMEVKRAIEVALQEDLALGDVTTDPLVSPTLEGKGTFLVKAPGTLAGIEVAMAVFHYLDHTLETEVLVSDGTPVSPGTAVGTLRGRVASILRGERTALNFLTRMSGIATDTARYVKAISGLRCAILDTRKTAPGLRALDKYAVRLGGGRNHRFHLGDGILVKDNHWQALKAQGLTLAQGVSRLREKSHHLLKVQVEVKTLAEAREALEAGAEALLLDNMKPEAVAQVVREVSGRALLEASGGITLENVRRVAETGVDFISVGALTHSPRALDISLELG